jgi:hypothetical protein
MTENIAGVISVAKSVFSDEPLFFGEHFLAY